MDISSISNPLSKLCVVAVFAGLIESARVPAQEISVFRSSTAGDRLSQVSSVSFSEGSASPESGFRINEQAQYQKMLGFGASFLEAGMICINSLEPAEQEKVFETIFDPVKGAGFTAMKTVIGATDFMSAGPMYTYADTPGDVEMKSFSIARDLEPNGLIPYIRRAQKHGSFILQATMDYPPDWMLVDVHRNQNVDKKYYDALALYFLRYLQEYQRQGIFIDYLSPFNEPMGYTKIPFAELRDLIKYHIGPLFYRERTRTRLQTSDFIDRVAALRGASIILDDPETARYVSGIAYHGYDWRRQSIRPEARTGYKFDEFKAIHELYRRYRGTIPVWMTEICYYNGGTSWAKPLPRYEFEDGDWWGQQIFSDIEAGAAGWTYWNLILDQNGGPWLVSPVHGNPENNVQHPVIIVDRETKRVTYTGLFYYLAHFSKFVRPSAARIASSGKVEDVRCLAFCHSDGRIVVQLMNSAPEERKVTLTWNQRNVEMTLPAVSITTCLWKKTS